MKPIRILTMLTVIAVSPGLMSVFVGCGSSRDVKPTLTERLSTETITGKLVRTDRDYYWLRDDQGRDFRIYIDDSTKMDKVVPGDMVKAYIEKGPHATTVQRIDH
jgi:hypothetical protein